LEQHKSLSDDFLDNIVTGDETWVHHYEPKSKRQSMEWLHKNSPTKKKFKTAHLAGKVMCTVFWDRKGVILVGFLEQGLTINAAHYVETLRKLKSRIALVWPEKKEHVLLQHNNARPHTALLTRECTAKFGWTVLPHPPYSPDLALSDFHLFGSMKGGL
jgi:histone-lysine N-methyltransferase SETMAR